MLSVVETIRGVLIHLTSTVVSVQAEEVSFEYFRDDMHCYFSIAAPSTFLAPSWMH
jgi:hypothetical protein